MRITRKPEQERAKLRGAGTTTEQAKVLLEEYAGGSWHAVSTRVGEADTEIADLMGMSADQFFQVVLLPQGEFARFLHADAGDRAKLLQRLFGTDRFHAVEEWLARRRKATADEVREAEAGISGLLARVAQAAGVPARADDAPPSDDASAMRVRRALPSRQRPAVRRRDAVRRRPAARGWAARLAEAATAEAAAGQDQVAGHRRELDRALDLLRDAERLADRQRRRQDALDTRDRLAAAEAGCRTGGTSSPPPPARPRWRPRWPRPNGPAAFSPRPGRPRSRPGGRPPSGPAAAAAACGPTRRPARHRCQRGRAEGGRPGARHAARPAGGAAVGVPAGGRRGPGRRGRPGQRGRAGRPGRHRHRRARGRANGSAPG